MLTDRLIHIASPRGDGSQQGWLPLLGKEIYCRILMAIINDVGTVDHLSLTIWLSSFQFGYKNWKAMLWCSLFTIFLIMRLVYLVFILRLSALVFLYLGFFSQCKQLRLIKKGAFDGFGYEDNITTNLSCFTEPGLICV